MCVGAESMLFAPCLSPPVSTWQAQACFYAKVRRLAHVSPAPAFTSVVGRPRPVSESENHCVQIVSSPSLEVCKERARLPVGRRPQMAQVGGIRRWDFPGVEPRLCGRSARESHRATLPSLRECFPPLPSSALKEWEGVERNPVAKRCFLQFLKSLFP